MSLRTRTTTAFHQQSTKALCRRMGYSLLLTCCICSILCLILNRIRPDAISFDRSFHTIRCHEKEKKIAAPQPLPQVDYRKAITDNGCKRKLHKKYSESPPIVIVTDIPMPEAPENIFSGNIFDNTKPGEELMQSFDICAHTMTEEMLAWFNHNSEWQEEEELLSAPVATSRPAESYSPARYLTAPKPTYPQSMKRKQIRGSVRLRIHVNVQGLPTKVEILDSPHRDFTEAVKRTVMSTWKFVPAQRNGTPTAEIVTTSIIFE